MDMEQNTKFKMNLFFTAATSR